jgi:hypothetical protein
MLLRDMLGRFCRKGNLWGRDRLWMPLLVYLYDFVDEGLVCLMRILDAQMDVVCRMKQHR